MTTLGRLVWRGLPENKCWEGVHSRQRVPQVQSPWGRKELADFEEVRKEQGEQWWEINKNRQPFRQRNDFKFYLITVGRQWIGLSMEVASSDFCFWKSHSEKLCASPKDGAVFKIGIPTPRPLQTAPGSEKAGWRSSRDGGEGGMLEKIAAGPSLLCLC